MDPDLIEFLGGLDLGMKSSDIARVDKRLIRHSEIFGITYHGNSSNNPILQLNVDTDWDSLLDLFLNKCYVSIIHAEFNENYLAANQTKSFKFWLSYFENIFQQAPIHFYNQSQPYFKDKYLWHFEHYNFEIWRDFALLPNIKNSIKFSAYLCEEEYPLYDDMTNLSVITDCGDTTQYSFLNQDLKALFGGFDIGMTIKNIRAKTHDYRVDKINDVFSIELSNGDKLELYLFDYIYGNAPDMIDGSVYKMTIELAYDLEKENINIKEQIIDDLSKKLDSSPIFFVYISNNIKTDIYLWHFQAYNFDIRFQYGDAKDVQAILYSVYKDLDSIPNDNPNKNIPLFDLY